MRGATGILAGVAILALAGSAAAQSRPSIDTRVWRPSTDPNASLVIEPAVTPGPGVLTLGGYASYAFHPVTLDKAGTDQVAYRPLAHSLTFDAIANYGIGKRLALGLDMPVLLYQNGDRNLPRTISAEDKVKTAGVGDLALSAKGSFIRNDQGGFGLAALATLTVPTADRQSFRGEGAPTVTARVVAEYTLLVAIAQASLGYTYRPEHRTWPSPETGGVRFGDQIPWSVGLALRPGLLGIDPANHQRLEVGVHGWVPAGPVGPFGSGEPGSAALSPVQLAVSDRIELGHYRDTFLTVGGEFALARAVGAPVFQAIVGIGWTPRPHDLDHDGVKDDFDGCPEIAEDRDGFEDSDGCPEIDNDDDGIVDKEDACPNVKGEPSSDPKKNGCPGNEPSAPAPVPAVPPAAPPNPDRDGDTFENDVDRCPDEAEVFNGIDDEDGCPDGGGKALVTIDEKQKVRLAAPLKTTKDGGIDPASLPTIRALAQALNTHPDWTLAVGAKPGPTGDPLARSFAVVSELSRFTRRDGAAETIAWDAVKDAPGNESGVAFLLLGGTVTTAIENKPPPFAPLPASGAPGPAKP